MILWVEQSLFGNNGWVDPHADINIISHQGIRQKIQFIFCSKSGTTSSKFHYSVGFFSYISAMQWN